MIFETKNGPRGLRFRAVVVEVDIGLLRNLAVENETGIVSHFDETVLNVLLLLLRPITHHIVLSFVQGLKVPLDILY